jgi:hypothetical protein
MPTSVLPPAGQGTMRVTGRAGKFSALAPTDIASTNPAAASAAPKTLRFMAFASVIGDIRDRADDAPQATLDAFSPQSQACVRMAIQS